MTNNTCLIISHADSDLVARNNVFVGSANIASITAGASAIGSGNWAPTGASIPAGISGTVMGAAPGFVSGSDLHLATGVACSDIGTAGTTYRDGGGTSRSAVPASTYEGSGALTTRSDDGAPDAGAYAGPSSGSGGGGSSPPSSSKPKSSAGGDCGAGSGVAGLLLAGCLAFAFARLQRL